jgi:hypothetical protein
LPRGEKFKFDALESSGLVGFAVLDGALKFGRRGELAVDGAARFRFHFSIGK